MDIICFMVLVAGLLFPSLKVSIAVDSILVSRSMSDGNTLVSQGGTFELGFFSPNNSNKRYLGIWYKNIPVTVVWVANRVNPINSSSGILTLNNTGNLILTQNGSVVWHTDSHKQAQNPVAVLLDSGNLVVTNKVDANSEAYLWQSFDYPSDTLLPGMKLGMNLKTDLEWRLTSWKSPEDPSPGDVSWLMEHGSYPELYIMKGTKKIFRGGSWNGLYFSGVPDMLNNIVFNLNYISNNDEIFYTYSLANNFVISIAMINQTSMFHRYVWMKDEKYWKMYKSLPNDLCDGYNLCGANAICRSTEPLVCQCLKGFSPKSPQAWNSFDWTQGCVRNKPLRCKEKNMDGFVNFVGLKAPDSVQSLLDETIVEI